MRLPVEPSQCTAIRYRNRLAEAGAAASIGSIGDSHDNATAELLIGHYTSECVRHDGPLRIVEELELATASWANWFTTNRLHSMIGNIPPVEYENDYHAHQQASEDHIPGELASTEPGAGSDQAVMSSVVASSGSGVGVSSAMVCSVRERRSAVCHSA